MKLERAREMGAHATVLLGSGQEAKEVLALTQGQGVEVVFENVGAAIWPIAMKALARGGRLVTCGATTGDQPGADLRRLFIRQLQVMGSTLGTLNEFRTLLEWVQRHHLVPVVDSSYALEEVHAALDRLSSGMQFGKVALHIGA
jgi:NADPH:quinone reductase-like Zn-dependent oxidoreductase